MASNLSNRATDALLFWIGRANVHLALERFSDFDGVNWQSSALDALTAQSNAPRRLQAMPAGKRTWFKALDASHQDQPTSQIFRGSLPEAVKFARLKSHRIPTMAGLESWHINQVDDSSFFRVDANDNLTMPDRKSVPEFTIVRFINREMDLESISRSTKRLNKLNEDLRTQTEGQRAARQLNQQWIDTRSASCDWSNVTRVIENLRQQFRLDRMVDTSTSSDPLADFFARRAGNDLMFATAAAVMLRELGFETRLVTGLVARAENRLGWTQELAVYAQDTHAWVEVKSGLGDWIPLEPTPGFPQPVYRISWSYWFLLNAWRIALCLCGALAVIGLAYWQRLKLFDFACTATWLACWMANDRQLCRWLITILDWRCRLVGRQRPRHVSPQRWYAALANNHSSHVSHAVSHSAETFFREADRLCFGNKTVLSPAGRTACHVLWTRLSCRLFRSAMQTSSSPQSLSFGRTSQHGN